MKTTRPSMDELVQEGDGGTVHEVMRKSAIYMQMTICEIVKDHPTWSAQTHIHDLEEKTRDTLQSLAKIKRDASGSSSKLCKTIDSSTLNHLLYKLMWRNSVETMPLSNMESMLSKYTNAPKALCFIMTESLVQIIQLDTAKAEPSIYVVKPNEALASVGRTFPAETPLS